MGVKGLWRLLLPIGRRISIETLEGKILAIDASIWLTQFLKAMRDPDSGSVQPGAHLIGFFRRLCKLRFQGIRPVFVFDGATPEIKQRELRDRRKRREQFAHEGEDSIQRMAKRLLVHQLKKQGTKLSVIKLKDGEQQRKNEQSTPANTSTATATGRGAATATSSYAPGFYDPQMESEEPRKEEKETQTQASDNDNNNNNNNNNDGDTSSDQIIIDLMDGEDYLESATAPQGPSDWDTIVLDADQQEQEQQSEEATKDDDPSKNDNQSKPKGRPLRQYKTLGANSKNKKNSSSNSNNDFDVEYVASLPSTQRKDMVEGAKRQRRMLSRREFMKVAYDPAGLSKCQLRNFLRSTKLNQDIAEMAVQTVKNAGMDNTMASDRTKRIIFEKDSDKKKETKQEQRAKLLATFSNKTKLSILASSSSDSEVDWQGAAKNNDDKTNFGVAGKPRAIVDDDTVTEDGEDEDEDGEEDEDEDADGGGFFKNKDSSSPVIQEKAGGFFPSTITTDHSPSSRADRLAGVDDYSKNVGNVAHAAAKSSSRSTSSDAKLTQELHDETLARALQDADSNSDGGEGGVGGFFKPDISSTNIPTSARRTIHIDDSEEEGGDSVISDSDKKMPAKKSKSEDTARWAIQIDDSEDNDDDDDSDKKMPAKKSKSEETARRTIQMDDPKNNDDDDDIDKKIPAKKSKSEDVRLAQELQDENLARALQDAEYADDSGGAGHGGFLPGGESDSSTWNAARKPTASEASDLSRDFASTTNRNRRSQESQDEILARRLQQEEDGSVTALHASSDYDSEDGFPLDEFDSEHAGDGGFLPLHLSADKHTRSIRTSPIAMDSDDSGGGGGGFLPVNGGKPQTSSKECVQLFAKNDRSGALNAVFESTLEAPERGSMTLPQASEAASLIKTTPAPINESSDGNDDVDWEDGESDIEDVATSYQKPAEGPISKTTTATITTTEKVVPGARGKVRWKDDENIGSKTPEIEANNMGMRMCEKKNKPVDTAQEKPAENDEDDVEWEDGEDDNAPVKAPESSSEEAKEMRPEAAETLISSIEQNEDDGDDYVEEIEDVNHNHTADELGNDDPWIEDFTATKSSSTDVAAALEHAQTTAANLTNWAGRAFRRAVAQHAEENGLLVPDAAHPKAFAVEETKIEEGNDEGVEISVDVQSRLVPRSPSKKSSTSERQSRNGGAQGSLWTETLDPDAVAQSLEAFQAKWTKERNQQERDMETITDEMKMEIMQLLQLFGVPYVEAPAEAEAQCVMLEKLGLVDGVVTEDSDAFVFGGQCVYKNIFDDQKFVEVYQAKDAEQEMNLTSDGMVALALLLGGDYTEGVRGVGIVNGMEVIQAFDVSQDLRAGLTNFRKWLDGFDPTDVIEIQKGKTEMTKEHVFHKKHHTARNRWIAPKHFPDPKVLNAYLNPVVDNSSEEFSWGVPDLERLLLFCSQHVGWTPEETRRHLEPVVDKVVNSSMRQTRLDSFMCYEDGIKFAHVRSKRLREVLHGVQKEAKSKKKRKKVPAKNKNDVGSQEQS